MSIRSCATDIMNIDTKMLTIRKPTELKKLIESVPKPERAIPKNGLPIWDRLSLDSKLPIPRVPAGRIVFSCGKLGENIRKTGQWTVTERPSFDLSDPLGKTISNEYVPVHDPHLTAYFYERFTRERMKRIGLCTKDGQAVCSLKEFNQYRRVLNKLLMDKIHIEMDKLNERAKDDLALKRVEQDVIKKEKAFIRAEKLRSKLELLTKQNEEELEERRRTAKRQQKIIQKRMKLLAEFNEQQRKEKIAKTAAKEQILRERIQAAQEIETRRKITQIRTWRINETRRLNRMKLISEMKQKKKEAKIEKSWQTRVTIQNKKIADEECLLKLYTFNMKAAAHIRAKKAEAYAFKTEMQLQRLKMTNWKASHDGAYRTTALWKKMANDFEKSKRGLRGFSEELARQIANESMRTAFCIEGDMLMSLGQARYKMEKKAILPGPPVSILDEMLETAISEFTRQRVHVFLSDIERTLYDRYVVPLLEMYRPPPFKIRMPRRKRWVIPTESEEKKVNSRSETTTEYRIRDIEFEPAMFIPGETIYHRGDMKSCKLRRPTPFPSWTQLADISCSERLDDLPEPTVYPYSLREREKLIDCIKACAKTVKKEVNQRVVNGLDLATYRVTLPCIKRPMEWGEAIENLTAAVIDQNIRRDTPPLRRASEYLSQRVLKKLLMELNKEKRLFKEKLLTEQEKKLGEQEKNTKVHRATQMEKSASSSAKSHQ